MRILVIEDHESVAKSLKLLLSHHSYGVDLALTGAQALALLDSFEYDLLIMDLLLPDHNGVDLCQWLRSRDYSVPILLLTGQDCVEQKALALNAGADDYVVKPFDHRELLARVQALLRRGTLLSQPTLAWGDLRLSPASRQVAYAEQDLILTPKEYGLLELLLRHRDRTFSAKLLLDRVWAAEEYPGEETVRTHIKGLRQKLRKAGAPNDFIETIHRVGYRLNPAFDPQVLASAAVTYVLVVAPPADQIQLEKVFQDDPALQAVWLDRYDEVWPTLTTHPPALALFSYDLDPTASLNLCHHLQRSERWQHLPVIFLIGQKTQGIIQQVFEVGACDVVHQPVVGPELRTRMANQIKLGTTQPVGTASG